MAHVVLDAKSTPPRLLIDGVDVALSTLANSITITDSGHEWVVSLSIAPSALDVDLPDAVIDAVRASDPVSETVSQALEVANRTELRLAETLASLEAQRDDFMKAFSRAAADTRYKRGA